MENKFKVNVEVEIKNDRFYFDILADSDLDNELIRSILVGAVALTIRGEKTPQKQGVALREVINHLESEFINVDSFNDVHINDNPKTE